MSKIEEKLREYYNVLKMARKPNREEFSLTAKVALVVMLIIGFVGFLIYIFMEVLPGAFR
ncbi:MAG: protein translocase SEC61 complex subunit gamma [Archaeoglobaceae archaeon]|nr:protein translocase SEC61 complex subunit gamma [Archaeoglobaceae archaeon]